MSRSFVVLILVCVLALNVRAQTWMLVNSSAPTGTVMSFGSNDTGFIANIIDGTTTTAMRSVNGGKAFSSVPLVSTVQAGKYPVTSVSWPTPECGYFGYALSGASVILRTVDAGKNWTPLYPGNMILDDISFPTAAIGYAACHIVGGDYYVLKSTDSGKSWPQSQAYHSNLAIDRIYFKSATEGMFFLFGGGPIQVGYTFDGMKSVQVSSDLSTTVGDLPKFLHWSNDNTWLAGISGDIGILRSPDSGKTWRQVVANDPTDPSAGGYGEITTACFHNRRGFAFPEFGPTVFATTDYGATWTKSKTGADTVNAVASSMPTSTVAYVVGPGGAGNLEGNFLLRIDLPADPDENGGSGSVAELSVEQPVSIFRDGPVIVFGMHPSSASREVRIVDVLGREWATISVEPMATSAQILCNQLTPGSYFARLGNSTLKFAIW